MAYAFMACMQCNAIDRLLTHAFHFLDTMTPYFSVEIVGWGLGINPQFC